MKFLIALLFPALLSAQQYSVEQYQDTFKYLVNAQSIIEDFGLDDEISAEMANT